MISRRLLPNSKFLLLSSPLQTEGGYYGVIIPLLSFILATNLVFSPTIHAQPPFYQGKSIRIITGGQAGALSDLWPRLIADHMGKHIAGNPSIVVQNMPGAGSVIG